MVLLTCSDAALTKTPFLLAEDFHHMLTELDVDTAEAETLMHLAGGHADVCAQCLHPHLPVKAIPPHYPVLEWLVMLRHWQMRMAMGL